VKLTYVSHSETFTENLGAAFARAVLGGKIPVFISLEGDMGAGKTAFVRGMARVLSPGSRVKSPTYTIVNEYRRGSVPLFHFDMYRISDPDEELYGIGFEDYLSDGICVAEWSSILGDGVPDGISVNITKTGDSDREIVFEVPDDMEIIVGEVEEC